MTLPGSARRSLLKAIYTFLPALRPKKAEPAPPVPTAPFENFRDSWRFIRTHYAPRFEWPEIKIENHCVAAPATESSKANKKEPIVYNPSQNFLRNYFRPDNVYKGMLLWHSTGTGKTCSAIATATTAFEPAGYTILWVTRTTLKADMTKNMFDQICHSLLRDIPIPEEREKRRALLSKAWAIQPLSYRQFSNAIKGGNDAGDILRRRNGTTDPLRKTLIILDEAHKLYETSSDLIPQERPDTEAIEQALHHSYRVSGTDSARVLLMTATPITGHPHGLLRLLNLIRPARDAFDLDAFAIRYLDHSGRFTSEGRRRFMDQIAGQVSYLNREKDPRVFAQPLYHHITVPASTESATPRRLPHQVKSLKACGVEEEAKA